MFHPADSVIITGIETASVTIEVLAVIIIFGAVIFGTCQYIWATFVTRSDTSIRYSRYKQGLGKSLLLGLEILVAADVIRTVALEQTIESIISLGILVLVRTFLSWALVVEIEGTWPWRMHSDE
ncbi:MAG: DUF1622 domain-containing protein [Methanospirillaceae archaeon]|nr:DUF1622 domain-containing protein [Methanospirillaceae archaeon]